MNEKTINFSNKLNKKYNNKYIVLEEYKRANIKIKVKHLKCNKEFEINPKHFLSSRSKGCNYCRIKNRTKTHDTFLKEVKQLVNDEYTILSEYVRNNEKIKIKHNTCDFEYEVTPSKFLNGRRCPNCFKKNKKSNKQWVEEVKNISNGEYVVIGNYVNNKTKVKIKHITCNNEYEVTPSNFKKGHRCPICSNKKIAEKLSLSKEEFLKRFKALNEPYYEVLQFKSFNKKMKIIHSKCGYVYDVLPGNFIKGNRCPNCKVSSIGESNIKEWLENNNIRYKREYWFNDLRGKCKKPLRFDFAILDENNNVKCLIEYDGRQHFIHEKSSMITRENFESTQKNDKIKNDYCKRNNITLFRIKYIYQKNINEILNKAILEEDSETIHKFAIHIAD